MADGEGGRLVIRNHVGDAKGLQVQINAKMRKRKKYKKKLPPTGIEPVTFRSSV